MSYGETYLNHRNAAELCLMAEAIALQNGNLPAARRESDAAAFHTRRADQVRSELLAARKLGLGGSAGQLPKNYFASA